MDLFDIFLNSGLITAAIVTYLIFFRRAPTKKGNYRQPGWNYPLKLICAWYAVRKWLSEVKKKPDTLPSTPSGQKCGWDGVTIRTTGGKGETVMLGVRKLFTFPAIAEVTVHVKLADGTCFRLPQHPETAIASWEDYSGGWSANGLKIQILDERRRMRVVYNGFLVRDSDNATVHVKFNFTWSSGSFEAHYPRDWSVGLASRALTLGPWKYGDWTQILGKRGENSWCQFGTLQGRLQIFNTGSLEEDVYMQMRGVRERQSDPRGYQAFKRSVSISATARDGTFVHFRALSYKDVLTEIIYGTVRFPNSLLESITSTDFILPNFCERPDGIPKIYVIKINTKSHGLTLTLRINPDGGKLLNGRPHAELVVYRTVSVMIDDQPGYGVLELGYEVTEPSKPAVPLTPTRLLRWLTETEAGDVGYCVPFEARAAACTNYVGGKGASLALLASVQDSEGYKVPPGYCLSTKALDKYLEVNPAIKDAILEIHAANTNYDEGNFKAKCNRAIELFASTEITGKLKDEILHHLKELRVKANEQKLSPELHFAVRSSAVGEDSEALSAAGQNDTVLGCVSDDDVLLGVQKCWGSMFAFTSAHYRRQNGQPCLCGGGVVIQALVKPKSAGVMFTRLPDNGDPSRLLITANYGLGESVVSGSVEPDTMIVSRANGDLKILSIELGSKLQRITTDGSGISSEEVPESQRKVPCLGVSEIIALAGLGVRQEVLWGAGRDIEWAVTESDIYLLQARPITSLERWSEEELLHEFDAAVMSDDELYTFANVGEVMPKPLSPLNIDLVVKPLGEGIGDMVGTHDDPYRCSTFITHYRASLACYFTLYHHVPKKIDIGLRMVEMAVHGHKVADENIHSIAVKRNPPSMFSIVKLLGDMFWSILNSNRSVKLSQKITQNMIHDKVTSNDPEELLNIMSEAAVPLKEIIRKHASTSQASSGTQLIAMSVLIEGAADFTNDHCNDINTMLSSGDVLSAEVPILLDQLARKLHASGKFDDFKAQKPTEALAWLKGNLPEIHDDVTEYLEKHGYRAVMEFDIATKPWVLEPEGLMQVLQNMPVFAEKKTIKKSNKEILEALVTPKKSSTRKALNWILPLCHRAVRHREGTKAATILAIHKLRLLVRRLGSLLVKEWYLSDEETIFFFSLQELKEYVKTRDPALLRKALQRQQHHPSWSKLTYPELCVGWPAPLRPAAPSLLTGDVTIQGTSVCGGEIVGRACVAKSLAEIDQLQRGDILITHATDIGWSPYFPLLSGIVTELGGLISHGAVIAREYGLPCIVGATRATDIFKTGDMVRLSGSKGLIERVQIQEKIESTGDLL